MDNILNWTLSMIFIPLIIFFIKNYIIEYLEDRNIYKTRMFDDDQNPKTGEAGWVWNEAKGIYEKVIIKEYLPITFSPSRRLILVHESCDEGTIEVPYTYKQWKARRKGKLIC